MSRPLRSGVVRLGESDDSETVKLECQCQGNQRLLRQRKVRDSVDSRGPLVWPSFVVGSSRFTLVLEAGLEAGVVAAFQGLGACLFGTASEVVAARSSAMPADDSSTTKITWWVMPGSK